jgi:hypothetical protein
MRYFVILISVILLYSCEKIELSEMQSEQFVKLFGTSNEDAGVAIVQLSNEDYVLVANSVTYNKSDIIVVRTDRFGNRLWEKTYGDSLFYSASNMSAASDDEIYIIGSCTNKSSLSNTYILKISGQGEIIFEKKIESDFNNTGKSIATTQDGGAVVIGSTSISHLSSRDSIDVLCFKINKTGAIEWSKNFGGNAYDEGVDLLINDDQSIMVVGNTNSFFQENQNKSNILVMHLNDLGVPIAMTTYGTYDNDYVKSVVKSQSGGYIIVGSTSGRGAGGSDMFIINLEDNIYTKKWEKTFGDLKNDYANDVISDSDYIYIAGYFEDPNTSIRNAVLLITDMEGNIIENNKFGSSGTEQFYALKTTFDKGVVLTGSSGIDKNAMITLVKHTPFK